jgi:hypothetical protein
LLTPVLLPYLAAEQSPSVARRDEIAGTFKQTLQNLDSLAKVCKGKYIKGR